jgi:hypothetical protein
MAFIHVFNIVMGPDPPSPLCLQGLARDLHIAVINPFWMVSKKFDFLRMLDPAHSLPHTV